MWNNMNNYFRLFIGSCVFLRETVRFVFGAVYSARMTMITHGCTMISHMCILICDTLLHCTAETRLVDDLDWNRQSGCAMCRKKQTPISYLEKLFKFYSSHLKNAIRMRRCFHDFVAQRFSTIFSARAYFSECHVSAIPTTTMKSTFL